MAEDFGNQLAMMDPATAAAIRRQMYAQQLLQQASDVSPVRSPWQAAARAVQGILGGYQMQASTSDLQDINKQQQTDALAFMGAGQGGGGGTGTGAAAAPAPAPVAPANPAGPNDAATPAPGNRAIPTGDRMRAQMVHDGMVARGYSDAAAWGFASNALHESGAQANAATGDNGQSHGIFQWNGDRLAAFRAANGGLYPEQTSLDKQLDFASSELGGSEKGSADAINGAKTPAEAAAAISTRYLRPRDIAGNEQERGLTAAALSGTAAPAQPPGAPAQGGTLAASSAGTPGSPVVGQIPAQPGGAAPPQGAPGSTGFQQAQDLRQKAMVAQMSTNPRIRAMAPYLMQQASSLMQMGAWTAPVQMPSGQYMIRNQFNNETKILGAQRSTVTAPNGDLIYTDNGQTLAKSGGYHEGPTLPNGGKLYFGPDGKPMAVGSGVETVNAPNGDLINKNTGAVIRTNQGWVPIGPAEGGGMQYRDQKGDIHIVQSTARPETQFANTIATVQAKLQNGQPLTAQDKADYGVAYNKFYPTERRYNQQRDTYDDVQTTQPPPGMPRPDELPAAGVKPQPGTAAPVPTVSPPPVSTKPTGPDVRSQDVVKAGVQNALDSDQKAVNEGLTAVNAGRQIFGTTQTIRDLQPQVSTGFGANGRLQIAQFLRGIGASEDAIQKGILHMSPSAGELMQKNLLSMTADRVRQMGAREPGSVISMFASAYPSLLSRPETIDTMTRIMDMDQRYKQDRAEAMDQWITDQRNGILKPGGLLNYKGQNGFKEAFDASHDPRVYVAAGLLASGQKPEVWQGGLTRAQQNAAIRLANSQYPAEVQLPPQQGQ